MYEVKLWLWQIGKGKPLFVGLADTEDRRTELWTDRLRRAVETRKRSTARRVQSDLALKKAGCAKIYHVYPILI